MESKKIPAREESKRYSPLGESKYNSSPRAEDDEKSPRIITLIEEEEEGAAEEEYAVNGSPARTNHNTPKMTLDFSAFPTAESKHSSNHNKDNKSGNGEEYMEPAIQEKDVLIVFELPDGSQGEKSFKYGHTIELLKSFVEGEYGIPMQEQELYLDDRKLENPFSLLDYPEVKGSTES